MRFSFSTILLPCWLLVAVGAAIEARAFLGLSCSEGPRVANFNDVPALPVDTINKGIVSGFNPHYDVNYTHFAVGNIGPNNNALFYRVDQVPPGPWKWWKRRVNSLIGVHGRLPYKTLAPTIVGSASETRLRLRNFSFGCGIRSGNGPPVHFDCAIIVYPLEATGPNQFHVCPYDSVPANAEPLVAGLQECTLPSDQSWTIGRGFTFQTVGRVPGADWFGQQSKLFNTTLPSTLLTAIDDVHYTEYCTGDRPVA
ncbi:hypothetical protein PFICI_09651 [Pestalotiopsis fici W106-1]|uniref:Uncharacterized protein n=1 Tax=Pestalotiopsis fici (strain W106-1 / CGMCC3.15140) TaxID=1229662 RepID=W3WUV0_PESFW|nr:uncharacterized protein PFICI_09651 [Pestalotiopsis fici W106-1]ETS77589.1 hypothetical protein PFICI_09651 [Pestalotiopsis fici W106-1]